MQSDFDIITKRSGKKVRKLTSLTIADCTKKRDHTRINDVSIIVQTHQINV